MYSFILNYLKAEVSFALFNAPFIFGFNLFDKMGLA
jgi:hypothetical protein